MVEEYKLFKNVYAKKVEEDVVGIYNPLKNHTVLFIDNETYQKISQRPSQIKEINNKTLETLINGRFLVPTDFDEDLPIKHFQQHIDKKPRISLMYLILTEKCNYRCTYCFIEENFSMQGDKTIMSIETCNNAIDYFLKIKDQDLKEN